MTRKFKKSLGLKWIKAIKQGLFLRPQPEKAGQTAFNLKVTLLMFPDYSECKAFAPQYLDFLLHKYSYDTDSWYQRSQRD